MACVNGNLAAVPWCSKQEMEDEVHTVLYLYGKGAGGGLQWGYNSLAVCGGLDEHV